MLYYIVKNVIQSRNVFLFSLIIRLSNTSVFMRRIKLLFRKAVSSQNSKAAKASHQIFNSYNTLSCKKALSKKHFTENGKVSALICKILLLRNENGEEIPFSAAVYHTQKGGSSPPFLSFCFPDFCCIKQFPNISSFLKLLQHGLYPLSNRSFYSCLFGCNAFLH